MLEVTQLWPHRNVLCVWPGPNATSVQFGHVVVLENYRLFDIFDFLVWAAYIWSVVPGPAKIRTFGHPRHPQFSVVWRLTVCLLRCFYNKDYFRLQIHPWRVLYIGDLFGLSSAAAAAS
jgi:hypothetical protein